MSPRLEQIASLGIDKVKVSMVWGLVAPDPTSTTKPQFDATDPAAYPPGAWDRYDTVVRLAPGLGISVYFQLTAPPPAWAVTTHPKPQPYRWHPDVQNPNPTEFGQFVEAVGRRSAAATSPTRRRATRRRTSCRSRSADCPHSDFRARSREPAGEVEHEQLPARRDPARQHVGDLERAE